MIIKTNQFGYLEIPEEEIITFPEGLYGFESIKEYVILGKVGDDNPFKWLQAVNDPDVCFVVIDPVSFKKDYAPVISENIYNQLDVKDPKEIRILSIVVIPRDASRMTANLKSPIIINARKNIALQVILEQEEYSTRQYILEEIKKGA